MSRTSSGSARSERAVNPTRATNRMETSLRSSCVAPPSTKRAPQPLQKREPAGFAAPQLGHERKPSGEDVIAPQVSRFRVHGGKRPSPPWAWTLCRSNTRLDDPAGAPRPRRSASEVGSAPMKLHKNAKIELLKRVPLFSRCTKKELEAIAAQADELFLPEGSELTRQGGHGREFMVIADRSEGTRLNSSHLVISYAVFCLK